MNFKFIFEIKKNNLYEGKIIIYSTKQNTLKIFF